MAYKYVKTIPPGKIGKIGENLAHELFIKSENSHFQRFFGYFSLFS